MTRDRRSLSVSGAFFARLHAAATARDVPMASIVEEALRGVPGPIGDVPRVVIEVSDELFGRAVAVARQRRGLNRVPAVDLIDHAILRAIDDAELYPDRRKDRRAPMVSHAAVRR